MALRYLRYFPIGIVSILSLASLSYAQQELTLPQPLMNPPGTKARHFSAVRIGGLATPIEPMTVEPSVFPLFIQDSEISSVITLINGTSVSSPAVLTIRDLQGKSYPALSIPVGAHAKMQIKMADLLQRIGTQLRTGSILVAQGPGVEAPSIVAQLTLSETTATPVALTEEELVMPMLVDSQDLRSVSESGSDAQLVAVTSLSKEPQNLTTQCFIKGSVNTKTTTLAPAGTVLIYPCSKNSPDTSTASLLGVSDTSNATGISIHTDGPNGGFATFGLSRHKSSTATRFLGSLQFVDPTSLHSSALVFTGISAGYSLTPGANPYSTAVALANFSAAESHVKIDFHKTDANGSVSTTSQNIVVAPQSSTQVQLGQFGLKAGEIGSLIVSSDQQPGDLIAKIVSSSDSAPNQLEQLAKDSLDDRNGGAHPWTLQNNARSDLVLFNHSSKTEPFNIWITSDDGTQWNQSVKLAPLETRTISINDLIRNKTPDSHGRTLPATALGGSVVWQTPVPGTGSGHILIRNEADASGESFSCGIYSSICGGEFTQYTTSYNVGQTATFGDFEADVCLSGWQGSCSGSFVGTGNDYTYFWQTSNSNVLSLADNYGNAVDLTANSAGSSDISFEVSDGSCAAYGDAEGTAGDQTPVIASISPSTWPAGTPTPVTITGQYFGTNQNQGSINVSPDNQLTITYSSWTDSTIMATITPQTNDPGSVDSVSVTSSGYGGMGFAPGPGQSSTSSTKSATVSPLQAVAPNIKFNGSDIVGTTQNVVVGQQIVLSEDVPSPQNQNIQSRSWSITSGTAIANYTASTSSGSVTQLPTTSNTSSYTFYWTSQGSSLTVSYSYTLTNGQSSAPVTATFNVTGPTVSNMNTPSGTVGIFSGVSGPVLGSNGNQFIATTTTPAGDSGQFEWVQLITNDTFSLTTTTGTAMTCVNETVPDTGIGIGLDTQYPQGTGSSTLDSPKNGLDSSTYQQVGRSFSAKMYYLWNPALPSGCTPGTSCSSIYVPLGSVTWGWTGTATYTAGNWTLTSSDKTNPSWTVGNSYPQWSVLVPYNGSLDCH